MREHKFEMLLGDLENMRIGLFLSDQQYIEGVLLAVKQDHLVIDVNKNIHYIARQHIEALSKNAKDFHLRTKTVPYLDRQHLTDVLNVLKYCFVTINGSSKRAYFGVLSKVTEEYIILINHTELLYIPKCCIANIHSEISDNQVRLVNHKEQLTSTTKHSATVNEEEKEMEINQLKSTPDSILQADHATKSVEASLEKETEVIQDEEGKSELQIVETGSIVGLEIPQQLEVEGRLESSNAVKENIPEEEQIIEVLDFESNHIEETLEAKKTGLQEESTFLTKDSSILVVQDAEHSSEVEDQKKLLPIVEEYKVELLSYSEPLGYERSFLLPDWNIFQKEREEMTTFNKQTEREESPTFDDHSVQLNDSTELIELWNTPLFEQQSTNESKNEDEAELLGEVSQSCDTIDVSITIRQMSPKEEKEMLEKQYFSLAKYAAAYSIKLEERSGAAKSTLHSLIEHDKKSRGGNDTSFEKQGKKNAINSSERQSTLEGQYVSLMNHAAKMYQQLKDL